jgi:membrane protease YdiL (CAAX protease family)
MDPGSAVDKASRTAALVEVTAMVALVLSYIWGWKGTFHGEAELLVGLYFGIGILSHLRRHESARQLGFRLDNWRQALRNAAAIVPVAVCVPIAIGALLGTWHFPSWSDAIRHMPWMLAWATAQQYGLLCFLYRRFLEILGGPRAAAASAAAIFAAFHVPNSLLLAVTLLAGVVSCWLYRREPNVLVLGIAHAAISFAIFSSLPFSITHGMRVGPGYLALR